MKLAGLTRKKIEISNIPAKIEERYEEFENSTLNEDVLINLKKELAAYMIPSKVLNMVELPLNTSGKVDRANLNLRVNEHFKK